MRRSAYVVMSSSKGIVYTNDCQVCKYSWSLTVIISHPLYYSRCMAIVPVAIVPVAIVPVAIVPVGYSAGGYSARGYSAGGYSAGGYSAGGYIVGGI